MGSDILGLYGQNGSAITTLVYAIRILKDILTGKSLVQDLGNYIRHEKNNQACLVSEKISMEKLVGDEWTRTTPVLYYNADGNGILPKNRYNLLTGEKQEFIDEVRVLRLLTAKEGRSFLFSRELRRIISE